MNQADTSNSSQRVNKKCCVFCGKTDNLTKDHIPPKCLFTRPRPKLITVPACSECNGGSSQQDELFKLLIGLKAKSGSEAASDFWENGLIPSVHNNNKIKSSIRQAPALWMKDKNGQYDLKKIIKCDASSHDETIEKITRGLYWHQYKTVLPINSTVDTYFFNELSPEIAQTIMEMPRFNVGGEDRFVYACDRIKDNPAFSTWFYQFYETHWAGAITSPNGFQL